MNILAFSGFVNGILFLLMGFFVFLKSTRSKLAIFFVLYCLAGGFWSILYGFWLFTESESTALLLIRIFMISASFIPLWFSLCFLELAGLTEKKKYMVFLFAGLTLASITLWAFTPIEFIEYSFSPYWPKAGIAFNFFLMTSWLEFGIVVFYVWKRFKYLESIDQQRMKYFGLALIISALAMTTNSPQWYGFEVLPYGNFVLFLSPLIIAFAVLKYHFFNIKVILTELLVGLMGIVLGVFPFLVKSLPLRILTSSVFLLFLGTSYFLIKYTHQEIKQKELLEEKVRQRTQELTISKERAEKAYQEVMERKKDLERFRKVTIGRELKMVELKKKIKEAKKET